MIGPWARLWTCLVYKHNWGKKKTKTSEWVWLVRQGKHASDVFCFPHLFRNGTKSVWHFSKQTTTMEKMT